MSKHPSISAARPHAPGLIPMLLLGPCLSGHASADTAEHASLAAALRQLDTIEYLVAEQPNDDGRARYHFDYIHLRADLECVRSGIRDYLSPSRAQPRDAAPLLGDYRQNVVSPPEPQATP